MPIITTLVTRRLPVGRFAVGPVVEAIARHHDLADDLARGEVAHQPLRAGVTERAIQRAADLRGNAQRAAVGFRNVDALDFMRLLDAVAARQAQQPFAGAVVGNLLGDHLRDARRVKCASSCARISLEMLVISSKFLRAADIDPVPQLLHAHLALRRRDADRRRAVPAISARDSPTSDGLCRRHVGFERDLFQGGALARGTGFDLEAGSLVSVMDHQIGLRHLQGDECVMLRSEAPLAMRRSHEVVALIQRR